MDRGGEEAIKEVDRRSNELLVEQLGRQMKELFSGLAQKQEADRRRGGVTPACPACCTVGDSAMP